MKMLRIIGVLVILITAGGGAFAQDFEIPQNRNIADILPANMISGAHYQIQEAVVCDGYLHNFTVFSDYGVFEATGDYALHKLLREIQAITALREVKKSKEFLEAAKQSATKPVALGVDLISHPVDTVTGVPKGAFRLLSLAGTGLTSSRDPSQDSRMKQLLSVSAGKRELAAQLGVDVYSSNPVLQKDLNSVAWAGAYGKLSVMAAMLPIGGTAGAVLSMTGWSKTFNDVLKENPPERLRQLNQEKLEKMGLPQDLTKEFLDHPSFTPRHDTILVGSLDALKGARGQELFIRLALTADDEESANFFQNMAETMRGYQETVSPIREIANVLGIMFAKAEDGSVLIPFPLDHGVWTERAQWLIPTALAEYNQPAGSGSKGPINFWVTGTVSALAKVQLAKLGVTVAENVDKKVGLTY